MTARVGADLDEVTELRRVFGRRADDVDDEAAAVGSAIDRFRARSSEYVPPIPPHRARGAELAARLDELGLRVERSRDAMRAADRWVGARAVESGYTAETARQAGVAAWRTVPGTWARLRRWDLDRATGGGRLTNRQVRFGVPGARGLPRRELAELTRELNATNRALRHEWDAAWEASTDWADGRRPAAVWTGTVEDAKRLAGRGPGAAGRAGAHLQDATSALGRGWGWVSNSRIGAVGRLGGTAVGVGGVAVGGWDLYEGIREGDTEQAVTGGLAAASAAAMFIPCPPVQVAAAIVTGGLLVYEYRDEIAGAVRTHIDRQVEAARRTAEFVGDVAGGATEAAGAAADAVGDMADAAWDAVKGLF